MWAASIAYILVVLTVTIVLAFLGTRGYSRWRVALQMLISLSIGFGIMGTHTRNTSIDSSLIDGLNVCLTV